MTDQASVTSNVVAQNRTQVTELMRRDNVPTYYANNVSFRTSFFDFTMDFGLIMDATEELLRIDTTATIIVSPQHAKIFADVLNQSVKKYEENYGPIPVILSMTEEPAPTVEE